MEAMVVTVVRERKRERERERERSTREERMCGWWWNHWLVEKILR
jgi:hypothetical protein